MSLADIPAALAELRAGRPIIVVDDEGRENEGDVILAASLATPEWLGWMVRHTSGYVCAPMPAPVADRLDLPVMVPDSQDVRGTAYTVSVDAAEGVTTGISASDRAHTLRALANPASTPASLVRPGHVLPLRAVPGGVRQRAGHTEATVELLTLAGLPPVGAIAEIVEDSGEMMRLPGLIALGDEHGVVVITIADLIVYLDALDDDAKPVPSDAVAETSRVIFEVETELPTLFGTFTVRAYRDRMTGADHVAILSGEPHEGMLLRMHSECLTGEVFGSLKCECGPQLESALQAIQCDGGAVIYMRGHEGRGIGLINKLKAYRLQEDGLDTVDANTALGLPADGRDYGAAVAILDQLGVRTVRLITNNPDKIKQLTDRGVTVTEQVPIVVGVGDANEGYLETKRDRMGHILPQHLAHTDVTIDEAEQARQSQKEQAL
ncbi:3,4-dihydroxy 2-butanone 4-phosphate synthase/GTP cyclohydrolase II [Homoserinimonas aerilata]|uniref:GTP cyclohydrolase-2 n=1 Tax=Homoserinimonas aerilata TaxID=1162970 RepID=A0A542YLA1_9MICO|nr:GTP cyclohydrolase II [Homoserinimonas aerilata]TQL48714.1 3,4-dihydroxy 2-butanone 4-phosphate synthase/GTP cyclohydrolase II [Homoserinimonas aerilata]